MQLALRTARIFWLKRTVKWSAVRPAPAPAGDSHWCHGFCQRDNRQNNIISLHRTTSAKTRATATLRQLHIPPNVVLNFNASTNENEQSFWTNRFSHPFRSLW